MPDALTTMLNMDSPSNFGAAPRPPTNVRRGVRADILARYLGIAPEEAGTYSQQDLEGAYGQIEAEKAAAEAEKAQLGTLPERVKGEYGLQTERMRGQSAMDVARANAERAATERETAREFTASQNNLNREAIAGRQRDAQAATTGRTAMQQQGINGRQRAGQAEGRAKLLESGKAEPTYPPTNGVLDNIQYYLGLGKYDKATAAKNEASQLRSNALIEQSSAVGDVDGVADYYAQQHPGVSGQSLLSLLTQEQPDASPEEIMDLASRIEQRQR